MLYLISSTVARARADDESPRKERTIWGKVLAAMYERKGARPPGAQGITPHGYRRTWYLSRGQLSLVDGSDGESGGRGGVRINVLLLIAHPDDEAMFFVPTLFAIRERHTVHVLRSPTLAVFAPPAPPSPASTLISPHSPPVPLASVTSLLPPSDFPTL